MDPKKKKSVSLDDQLSAMESSTNKRVKSMKNEFDDPSKPWNDSSLKPKAYKPKPATNWEKTQQAATGAVSKAVDLFFNPPGTKKPTGKEFTDMPGGELKGFDPIEEQVNSKAQRFKRGLGEAYDSSRAQNAATEIDDPEFKKAFEEEKKITPDDEMGARARAKKRTGR